VVGDNLKFTTSGSEKMRITSTGVGIGTSSPAEKLDVNGSIKMANGYNLTWGDIYSNGAPTIYAVDSASSASNYIHISPKGNATSASGGVRIDSAGNVGVGTSSPSANLEVSDSDGAKLRLTRNDASVYPGDIVGSLEFYNKDADGQHISSFVRGIAQETYGRKGDLVFGTAGTNSTDATEKMRLLASGGITFNGDTAAANALDDYEEGTWTPTFGSGSSIDNVVGTYTKIGNRVSVQLNLENGTLAGATTATMGGLPYAVYGDRSATSSVNHYKLFPYDSVQGLALPNTTTIVFLHARANAGWYSANFSNGVNRYLTFTATYRTS
jgi:hypothetical protein